ncbi:MULTISPECIES: LOG family protein [Clostridium]|jgi:predicted Rossmann-fold nucleotide-binding protein|uniref:LOG family protein n=1 Tax=Clostridium TaxID=1485 RepID=UPI0024308BF6|nr:LOG family protein [Clostridium tyrobutyricum]
MINSIKIQGTISFDPKTNIWSESGNGWRINMSDQNKVKILFNESIMFDVSNPSALNNYSLILSNINNNGNISAYDLNQDGFCMKCDNYTDFTCMASFLIEGTKANCVPDDRDLTNEESVTDIYAAGLLFDYEAKYGFVSVMGSASINSNERLDGHIDVLNQHLSSLNNNVEAESDSLTKKSLSSNVDRIRRRIKRQKDIRRNSSKYWNSAKEFGMLWGKYAATDQEKSLGGCYVPLCTGGGPGIMRAVAEGGRSQNAQVIGIDCQFGIDNFFNLKDSYTIYSNMRLRMNNFSIREGMMLNYSHVILFWPGGYGTLWEVAETLSKIQTMHLRRHRVKAIFVHREYWEPLFKLVEHMREYGTVNSYGDRIKIPGVDDNLPDDAYIAEVVDTAQEAFSKTRSFVEELYKRNELELGRI